MNTNLNMQADVRGASAPNISRLPTTASYEAVSEVYSLASFLLTYPDDEGFWDALEDARDWVNERIGTHVAFGKLQLALDGLAICTRAEAAKVYVDTFDFREKTSLFLTAHELGDSRSRGPALIALRRMFQQYGFEEASEELPDYLPVLFEFLSVAEPRPEDIEKRLAVVCQEIRRNLEDGGVYAHTFDAVIQVLPRVDTDNPFPLFEHADLDELPYPLLHNE